MLFMGESGGITQQVTGINGAGESGLRWEKFTWLRLVSTSISVEHSTIKVISITAWGRVFSCLFFFPLKLLKKLSWRIFFIFSDSNFSLNFKSKPEHILFGFILIVFPPLPFPHRSQVTARSRWRRGSSSLVNSSTTRCTCCVLFVPWRPSGGSPWGTVAT